MEKTINARMESIIPSEEDIKLLFSTAAMSSFQRCVRFDEKLDFSSPMSCRESSVDNDDNDRLGLWYDQSEIESFKVDVRTTLQLLRKEKQLVEERAQIPGLELWMDIEGSKRRRSITIACTLQAYRMGMSDEQIAIVAQRCTDWSLLVAFVQGLLDYCDVYEPKMSALLPKVLMSSSTSSTEVFKEKKRQISSVQPLESRKASTRRRLE